MLLKRFLVLLTLLCLLSALLLIRAVERFDETGWNSGHALWELMRLFMHLSFFGLVYLLTWRPLSALAVTFAVVVCLTGANAVKKQMVFEPIVFSDLGLMGQIVRHPKLYFLDNLPLVIASVAVIAVSLGAAFWLEPVGVPWAPAYGVGVVAWGWLFLAKAKLRRHFSALLLDEQLGWGSARLGLLCALVLQFVCWLDWRRVPRATPGSTLPNELPDRDVIVVQLESFIDLTPFIGDHHSIWSELQARSRMHGKLRVPARGANTMRTEHAVLSGVANATLQLDRFDPYLRRGDSHQGIPAALAARGWKTVFIHPNDLRFFRRDKALPELGFDRLVGQEAFEGNPRIGPYVGDMAVVREVITAARASMEQHFIFAVTMENHGPWKAGRLPGVAAGLQSYLAHQHNTDAALRCLLDFVSSAPRRVTLVLYGDHAPALASLPSGIDSSLTDYVIVDNAGLIEASLERDLLPEELLAMALSLNQQEIRTRI